jgi:hypothetical protein
MNAQHILVTNHLLAVPATTDTSAQPAAPAQVATVLSNMAYFGYAPSLTALGAMQALSMGELEVFWAQLKQVLAGITGADRNMGEFVVYKNFPKEVLNMSEGQYWLHQILMYLGAPNEWFTEPVEARAPLNDKLKLKVLGLANESSLQEIYQALVLNKSRWTGPQLQCAEELVRQGAPSELDLGDFGFKENGIRLIAGCLDMEGSVRIPDATDVLRLAAALSEKDVSLQEKLTFRNFTRSERRFLLSMLEGAKNLHADMAMRSDLWKKFLSGLHPGDFKFAKVSLAYDALYKGKLVSFNASVEANLFIRDALVLEQLQTRPGEMLRRLHKLYALFGMDAVRAFTAVAGKLTTSQLLKLQGYLRTVNRRAYFMRAPKGNWTKAKVMGNEKKQFSVAALNKLFAAINEVLGARLEQAFPQGVALADDTDLIKLQTNDQELASYGRGTVFPIPPSMTFLRSASYWEEPSAGNTWFDNGWNFFDANWNALGSCCWTSVRFGESVNAPAASFSGDPTNSKDLKGRGCQMVDLNLDQLHACGVRYAVWNVLAFSHIKFSDAKEVLATLQWGEAPQKGALYEPARAQMVFPLKGASLTKYVAMVDVKERKLVYLDANLKGSVSGAQHNASTLSSAMPAFMEYLQALPSVNDLFANVKQSSQPGATPVLYSDADVALAKDEQAYVFKPENAANSFVPLRLEEVL